MAIFLTASELNLELEYLIREAQTTLVLICPFIKLHDRLKDELKKRIKDDQLHIIVVFGKNEEDMSRSMKVDDLNFFLAFPHVTIGHQKNLHAKYYANESKSLLTSMNLLLTSQNSNIEVGVVYDHLSSLNRLANSIINKGDVGSEAWNYFQEVVESSELIFKKIPKYEKGVLGLTKKYCNSSEEINRVNEFFNQRSSVFKEISSTQSFNSNQKKERKLGTKILMKVFVLDVRLLSISM